MKLFKKKKLDRSELLEDYFNKKYKQENIYYPSRTLQHSKTRFKLDVRNFFTLNDQTLQNTVKSLRMILQTDNQKALNCLKYIIQNIPYKQEGVWNMPYETLTKRYGSSEDQAILLANMLIVSGIPNWKVRINCGLVFEPISKKQITHLYLTFFDQINEKWVILDTYFYVNIMRIIDREEYKKEKMYQDVCFSFNNEFSWAKNSGDVRNMEGFNNDKK